MALDFADFSSGLEKALRNERRTENPPEIASEPIKISPRFYPCS